MDIGNRNVRQCQNVASPQTISGSYHMYNIIPNKPTLLQGVRAANSFYCAVQRRPDKRPFRSRIIIMYNDENAWVIRFTLLMAGF